MYYSPIAPVNKSIYTHSRSSVFKVVKKKKKKQTNKTVVINLPSKLCWAGQIYQLMLTKTSKLTVTNAAVLSVGSGHIDVVLESRSIELHSEEYATRIQNGLNTAPAFPAIIVPISKRMKSFISVELQKLNTLNCERVNWYCRNILRAWFSIADCNSKSSWPRNWLIPGSITPANSNSWWHSSILRFIWSSLRSESTQVKTKNNNKNTSQMKVKLQLNDL